MDNPPVVRTALTFALQQADDTKDADYYRAQADETKAKLAMNTSTNSDVVNRYKQRVDEVRVVGMHFKIVLTLWDRLIEWKIN
jgi:hypothetical protein